MKKLTKTIFVVIVLTAPLFFMACEEETTFVPAVNDDVSSSEQTEGSEDIFTTIID